MRSREGALARECIREGDTLVRGRGRYLVDKREREISTERNTRRGGRMRRGEEAYQDEDI